ncbi:hypothetical protein DFA_06528 [Cavenderia fasciculata]|uniref:Ankyrin repeat-containing protein n=1 Tax=Cavenderia fasciculata TaxID=261658 RepID=F4PJ92_CACFS|nr:uncharacterized protein DFA_06528 [Cavenderia fasciculata]EGG24378.1 hypothetical protein DFA_06528 [Cavenderia fasciculata]|eukprot:XP_004362229.1 hypothetical protein DFA_06528 [Cavenderia fasciculata]
MTTKRSTTITSTTTTIGGYRTTFHNIFKVLYLRNKIFNCIRELSRLDNSLGKKTIKGKELIQQSSRVWFETYGMPWDFIKHYLLFNHEISGHGEIEYKCRCELVNMYIRHPNASSDTLKHLLVWGPTPLHKQTFERVLANGNYDMVVYLTKIFPNHNKVVSCETEYFEHAFKSGNVKLVRWLYQQYPKADQYFAQPRNQHLTSLDQSCKRGHFEMIDWLYANKKHVTFSTDAMDYAAEIGNLPILRFLLRNRTEGCTIKAFILAAINGHIQVLKYLFERCPKTFVSQKSMFNVFDQSAINNHLDVVKYLHLNHYGGDKCTIKAMDGAASLEMVQWLHGNRTEGCSFRAIDQAASTGKLDIIKYLIENRKERYTLQALQNAVDNGHFHVLSYLYEIKRSPITKSLDITKALKNGFIDIIKFLKENGLASFPTLDNVQSCLDSANLEMVQLFFNNYKGCPMTNIIRNAIHQSTTLELECNESVVEAAIVAGSIEIVKYLFNNNNSRTDKVHCSESSIKTAFSHHHINIAQFLYTIKNQIKK